ncbi:hypothetical protein PRNP1_012105 [Phytophthora ramorum]
MSKEGAKTSLLQPEAAKADGDVPEVYRSLNFRSLRFWYSQNRDTMGSRYSTLRDENLETMLNGGLERFYKKYDHLSRKVNIQLPTPEVRFENLSFTVQVPASVEDHGTPTPEVVEMFDDILMVNEGHMMYHGPRTEILDYFEERGFTCPPRVDPADFLIEVTSGRGHRYANGSIPTKDLPVSSEDFNNLFCQSSIYRKTHEVIGKGFNEHQFENAEDFKKAKSVANLARSKQTSEFGLAFVPSTMLLLNRQKLVWLRDPPLLWGKLTEALIIGLVMGMIYFDVSSTYYLRMIFFSTALFQRQAWQQITISFQLRKVFYKQRPRNFFRTSSYAIAESVVQIPVNMADSFVLGTFFYFMRGLTRTFEKYIVFYLVLLCFQHAISAYMTMLSSLAPSITVGQALAAISVSFFLLFSGTIILADLIPDYWVWMYWFSPISWALRSNMLSEFSSERYSDAVSKAQLESFSIKQGTGYIWFGVAVLIVYYFAFTSFNALALHYIRYEKFTGVSAKATQEESSNNVYVEVSTPSAAQPGIGSTKVKGGGLPFTPTNLCIKDLDYYVTLPSGEERQLLRKITAHFEPGRMVALMGATGAGKTTLMDVIAGKFPITNLYYYCSIREECQQRRALFGNCDEDGGLVGLEH